MPNPLESIDTIEDSCRILIVEDEVLIGINIQQILEGHGHHVVGLAISYSEAIDILNRETVDLVLLDIRLYGDKSGIDVANYINSLETVIPIVFLTSQTDDVNLAKALDVSPAGILSKPIQNATLHTTIRLALHKPKVTSDQIGSLSVKLKYKKYDIPYRDILFVKSDHVYVHIYLLDGSTIMKRISISSLMERMPAEYFLQPHRSYIINKKYIEDYKSEKIILGEHIIPVSRNKRNLIIELLQ